MDRRNFIQSSIVSGITAANAKDIIKDIKDVFVPESTHVIKTTNDFYVSTVNIYPTKCTLNYVRNSNNMLKFKSKELADAFIQVINSQFNAGQPLISENIKNCPPIVQGWEEWQHDFRLI